MSEKHNPNGTAEGHAPLAGVMASNFCDKQGHLIKDRSVVKVFHFTGVNGRGNGRKHYYMYKLIRYIEPYWMGIHLTSPFSEIPPDWKKVIKKRLGYILPMTKVAGAKYKQVGHQLKDYEVVDEPYSP